jgi:hypothetical protein
MRDVSRVHSWESCGFRSAQPHRLSVMTVTRCPEGCAHVMACDGSLIRRQAKPNVEADHAGRVLCRQVNIDSKYRFAANTKRICYAAVRRGQMKMSVLCMQCVCYAVVLA